MIDYAGFALGIALECLFMIYYANTTFYPKKSYAKSIWVCVIGYFILLLSELTNSRIIFVTAFFAINFILFSTSYNIGYKNAAFQSMMLNILLATSEFIIMRIFYSDDIESGFVLICSKPLSFMLESKALYFIGILIMKKLVRNKKDVNESAVLVNIAVPAVTMVIIILLWDEAAKDERFLIVYILLLFINIVVFAANEIIILRGIEMQRLIKERADHEAELEGYRMLYEKYEKTRIMRHDFKEQINVLRSLIADNKAAEEYMKKIRDLSREIEFTEYTDNKILNILFGQKIQDCADKGIELYINSAGPSMDFLSETDTVAIFSNLINNAIEGCMKSKEKNIFIDLETINDAYTVIKVENNSDEKPFVRNDSLITRKKDIEAHGIGMKSIYASIKKYGGKLNWSYDAEKKFFRTVIVFEKCIQ